MQGLGSSKGGSWAGGSGGSSGVCGLSCAKKQRSWREWKPSWRRSPRIIDRGKLEKLTHALLAEAELKLAEVRVAWRPPRWGGAVRELSEKEVRRLVGLLKPYYRPGCRHWLFHSLSFAAAVRGVSPVSIAKMARILHDEMEDENPPPSRSSLITYTYAKLGWQLPIETLKEAFGGKMCTPKGEVKATKMVELGTLRRIIVEQAGEEEAERVVQEALRILCGRRLLTEKGLVRFSPCAIT